MNALVSSVDGVDYGGQFYKQCDPALIPVQEGDIASSDPAADSPQGPPTDVETCEITAPSGAAGEINRAVNAEIHTYAAFNLDKDTTINDLSPSKQPAPAPAVKKPKSKSSYPYAKDGDDLDGDFIVKSVVGLRRSTKTSKRAPDSDPPSLPYRELRRERQKSAVFRDPDMLDPDAALKDPEYDDKPEDTSEKKALLLKQEVEFSKLNGHIDVSIAKEEEVLGGGGGGAAAAPLPPPPPQKEEEQKIVLRSAEKPRSSKRSLSTSKRDDDNDDEELLRLFPAVKKATRVPPSPKQTPPPPPSVEEHATTLPYQQPSVPPHSLTQEDILLGCNKCRYTKTGCGTCRERPPAFTRPPTRWNPFEGHHQVDIPAIPPFRPTEEEFKDPVAYITKIMPEATKYGLAHIIPPEGWNPPFALEKGTNGVSMESFKFSIRKQLTSHLCYRSAPLKSRNTKSGGGGGAEGGEMIGGGEVADGGGNGNGVDSRYNKKKRKGVTPETDTEPTIEPSAAASDGVKKEKEAMAAAAIEEKEKKKKALPAPVLTADDVLAALIAANDGSDIADLVTTNTQPQSPTQEQEESEEEEEDEDEKGGQIKISGEFETVPINTDFGFVPLEKKHTLRSFAAYADWVKAVHFSDPPPLGQGSSTAPKRRPLKVLPVQHSAPVEPSVEEIEAEFWRIVETPDTYLESLYGQDLDSGHHGSGFPLPEWRRRLLETHLTVTKNNKISTSDAEEDGLGNFSRMNGRVSTNKEATRSTHPSPPPPPPKIELPPPSTDAEKLYAEHPWNINNMPRSKSSMLRYLLGDGLITGVMVPWLYVGSCLSAFCWHVEDHALYSVNYLHMGAPKVWYGVPADATLALEEAMKDALPHLFESNPGLLHQLVTTLSPMELKKRGVPVHRVVHEAGSFIVTMPDAYHSGFNTGFNCAEAVNFAAPGWIPFGTDISQKYRDAIRPVTMSHDSLLVALATAAQHVEATKIAVGEGSQDSIINVEKGVTTNDIANNGSGSGTGSAKKELAGVDIKEESQKKVTEKQEATTAAAAAPPAAARQKIHIKQANGFGPLGDIPWADAPLDGIILGTGELALRAAEEKERWAAGAAGLIQLGAAAAADDIDDADTDSVDEVQKNNNNEMESSPGISIDPSPTAAVPSKNSIAKRSLLENVLPCRTMDPCSSKPGSKHPVSGVYEDTAEVDCEECQGDLWLAAVVSSAAPGVAVCPEHAVALVSKHKCPLDSLVLLCRYSPGDLQQLVDIAVGRIQGAEEAVAAAHARREKLAAGRVRAVPVGPLYPTNELGECIGSEVLVEEKGGAAVAGDVPPGPGVQPPVSSGKKRGRKPKKKKNYNFKKKKRVEVVDDAPREDAAAAAAAAMDVDSVPLEDFSSFLPVVSGAGAAAGIRSSDRQLRHASDAAFVDVGLDDVAEFAAVLESEFRKQQRGNYEAPVVIREVLHQNGEGSLQYSAAPFGLSTAPGDCGLDRSNVFVSGRSTSISEVMPIDLAERQEEAAPAPAPVAVEAEVVKEEDAPAMVEILTATAEAQKPVENTSASMLQQIDNDSMF
ncbi:hypothetical protein Ndes2526A_g01436 [Nannochloris sp. 'desiccata']